MWLPLAAGPGRGRVATTIGQGGGHHFRSPAGIAGAAMPRAQGTKDEKANRDENEP